MNFSSRIRSLVLVISSFLVLGILGGTVLAGPYGRGAFGTCTYNDTCSISIASDSTVSIPLQPTGAGVYTIAKDDVEVTTNNSSGFSLSLESNSATENALEGSNGSIEASSATTASPAGLDINTWGFRVDDLDGFGSGPTSSVENASSSSLTFAGVPLLGDSIVIQTSGTSALSGLLTEVWYGARADISLPADTYTATVIYTAVTL